MQMTTYLLRSRFMNEARLTLYKYSSDIYETDAIFVD